MLLRVITMRQQHQRTTGSTDRRAEEILREMRELTQELEGLVMTDPRMHDPPLDPDLDRSGEVKIRTGLRVIVLTGDRSVNGLKGIVGKRKSEKYWWVRLSNGEKIYRAAKSLAVVSNH